MNDNELTLSIVIPVKNEEDNIEPLVDRIEEALKPFNYPYEIIYVDDGSVDRTFQILMDLKKAGSRLKIIKFAQNYGQTAAMDAGLRFASGKYIVTIDGDMQNDPRDIPRLIKKADEGFDMVCGYRKNRQDSWFKKLSSRIANSIRNRITNENIIDTGCTLKLFNSKFIPGLKLYEGMHRFLPTLMRLQGAKVAQIPVNHYPRQHGSSKYGFGNRVFKALKDLLAVRWMQKRYLKYKIESKY